MRGRVQNPNQAPPVRGHARSNSGGASSIGSQPYSQAGSQRSIHQAVTGNSSNDP
eukprot:gene6128-16101_t